LDRGEDTDLSFRLRRRGFELRYIDAPVVWHAHPTRAFDLLRRKFWYGFWLARVYLRHPGRMAENTRTPRLQLVAIALWLLWLPASFFWGAPALVGIPLRALLTSLPLLAQAGPVAMVLTPLGALMNAAGLVAGSLAAGLPGRAARGAGRAR
jgi:cellulose synthase/poly-beta-1,6-N-acetylglucosamine synthase-like glycosyltransferase